MPVVGKMTNQEIVSTEIARQSQAVSNYSRKESQIKPSDAVISYQLPGHTHRTNFSLFHQSDLKSGVIEGGLNQRANTATRALGTPHKKPAMAE